MYVLCIDMHFYVFCVFFVFLIYIFLYYIVCRYVHVWLFVYYLLINVFMFLVGLNGFVKTINLIFSPHKSQKSQFLSNMENYVQIDRMSNLHINVPSEILKR